MKPRMLLALAMLLVLLMSGSLPAAAGGPEVPFRTVLTVQPTFAGPLIVDGQPVGVKLSVQGWGDVMHLGASTWHADMWINFSTTPSTLGADFTFTADNGDTLTGWYAGVGEPLIIDNKPYNHCWGEFVLTGGTGRFAHVAGAGAIEGWHPADGSPGPLKFDGDLVKNK